MKNLTVPADLDRQIEIKSLSGATFQLGRGRHHALSRIEVGTENA
jgi:hypothetical protein